VLRMPIAHHDGNYFDAPEGLDRTEAAGQVVLRYCDPAGADAPAPNGAARSIAGVCNGAGNVIGLMPHPERAAEPLFGPPDGARFLGAFVRMAREGGAGA
jgi:phosphoribosylformylglycinamidine synthase subunit PurQ / glutaminase